MALPGFVGQSLISYLIDNCFKVNYRDEGWESNLPNSTEIFVNCIGKAHDHNNEYSEQDFFESNYQVVKKIYDAF
ncbi:hypothetical protein JJC04_00480 [Flavobacterium covae]|nr:hypothetical protein [Flavobacterium covae]QYS91373.1 hypothetical protein JJC04_00480 [Flavobacterium covae]